MTYPSSALNGFARHYLTYFHTWDTFVDDSYVDESSLGSEENVNICAPGIMMWAGEGRTVNGQPLSYATPGLNKFTDSSNPDFTSHRWARVVKRPVDADDTLPMDGPIRQRGDGTDDLESPWFELSSWAGALPENGWGGSEVTITVHDPLGIYAGIFTEGRSISIYVEEFEEGALVSASELFSGFVLDNQNDDVIHSPSYTFRAGTIEALYRRRGNDGGAALFVSEVYSQSIAAMQPGQGPVMPTTGLIAANFAHILPALTPGRVIAHLMLWHMWVRVDGDNYRLSQVVNFRRDYWNDIPVADAEIPALAINDGNIMDQIAGLLPQGIFLGYCGRICDFTVTVDHEFKAEADEVLDTIDLETVYSIKHIAGENNTVAQVISYMAPSMQLELEEEIKEFKYPSSPVANRSIKRQSTPMLVKTQEGGDRINKGIFDKENSRDQYIVHMRGALADLHNVLSINGDDCSMTRITHQYDDDNLGCHETIGYFRVINIS